MSERAKDETFRLFVEQIKDHAVFMIGTDGRNLTWNEGVRRVFGYEEDEWIGRPAEEVFTPEDRAAEVPRHELETAAGRGRASDDRWMVRKGDVRFWASGITSRLVDEAGALIGYAKVVRDLTDTKRTAEALRAGEERLRLALEAAGMGPCKKPEGEPLSIGEGMSKLLGIEEAAATIGMPELLARVHPDDRQRVEAAFRRTESEGCELRTELRVCDASGALRWLLLSGRRFTPEAERPYVSGVLLDITERKRTEARFVEAQRMDAVGQLAGGVAHEINNMLTAILGFADLILWETSPGDPRRADLEQVHYAATRAATITGQLLAFGRRQVLQPKLIDLNAAVRPLEPVLRHVLGEDKVLETEYARGLSPVLVDPGQIEQVILNLVLNARDALDPGGHVRIRTRSEDVPETGAFPLRGAHFAGRAVVLSVRDDGRGMDGETRARAFEPFFTTKPIGHGTGLGLPTVLGIVQQSGGAIRLTTGPGQGTHFEIFFPEAAGEAAAPAERASETELARRETVLVVEDEDLVRNVTCRYLVAAGYRCLEAADGLAALELLHRSPEPIALVLADLVMPRMGGRELAEAITASGRDVPVLFLTGYAQEEGLRRGAVPPGGAVLQKPFTPTELIARDRTMLDEG